MSHKRSATLAHLWRCARCRAEAAAMSEIAVALAMLPPEMAEDLMTADDDPPGDVSAGPVI